jgi:hypothetical protein
MHEISHRPPLAVLIVVLLATGACAARPTAVSVPDSTSGVPDWAAVIAVPAGALLFVEEKDGHGSKETLRQWMIRGFVSESMGRLSRCPACPWHESSVLVDAERFAVLDGVP